MRSTTLRGAHFLAYLFDKSRSLRSVRLVSHPVRSHIQRFPKCDCQEVMVFPPNFNKDFTIYYVLFNDHSVALEAIH